MSPWEPLPSNQINLQLLALTACRMPDFQPGTSSGRTVPIPLLKVGSIWGRRDSLFRERKRDYWGRLFFYRNKPKKPLQFKIVQRVGILAIGQVRHSKECYKCSLLHGFKYFLSSSKVIRSIHPSPFIPSLHLSMWHLSVKKGSVL